MAVSLFGCLLLCCTHALVVTTVREVSYITCSSTKMNSAAIGTYPCRSKIECAVMCLNDPDCASASYCSTTSGFECRKSGFYTDGSCLGLFSDSGCEHIEVKSPCQNGGSYFPLNRTCDCVLGFVEIHCQRRFRDCIETPTGANHLIQPFGSDLVFSIRCDPQAYNGTVAWGTTGKVAQNFSRTWTEFETGIPSENNDFKFLGLAALHALTQQGRYDLRMVMIRAPPFPAFKAAMVWYGNFKVDTAANGYALSWDTFQSSGYFQSNDVQDALGGMGDSSKSLQGARFGTFDNDVGGCSVANDNSGWWYNQVGCGLVQPNSLNPRMIQWPYNDVGIVELNYTWTTIEGQLYPISFYVT